MCVGRGWGSKNWASSFRVILGFLVVSLQFKPADARVLVEHPVPRCPSCTPVLFGIYVNSPPPHKYFIIIPCETNIFSCHGDILNSLLEYFHHSDFRTEFLHLSLVYLHNLHPVQITPGCKITPGSKFAPPYVLRSYVNKLCSYAIGFAL